MMKEIQELVNTYKNTSPEIVFEWHDSETNSTGWLVINSLRGGAAGGGTRMSQKVTKDEVISLAKTMEIKFSVAGPNIGGAKSGILTNFNPNDSPEKKELVLSKWYKVISPFLKNYYGTGGDLNISEKDCIKFTKLHGVKHPQEGIVIGHVKENADKTLEQLNTGVTLSLKNTQFTPTTDGTYKVDDMVTGYGVVEACSHYYSIFDAKNSLFDKRVIVQGWGAVGAAAGYFFAQKGAKVVAISDGKGAVVNDNGFSFEEISKMFKSSSGGFFEHNEKLDDSNLIYTIKADIFAPCAASFLVNKEQIGKLLSNGIKIISCGANVPFADQNGGNIYSDITLYVDNNFSLIPDFIANCGMAHTFAYLMQKDIEVTESEIFDSVSNIISIALSEVKSKFGNNTSKLTENSIRIALEKLGY